MTKGERRDLYQEVTDRIVASLDAGVVPWRKPWRTLGGQLPTNVRNGRPYRGINIFLLAVESLVHGYTDPRWGTYKAIGESGGQVRKGEKGTTVVFWKKVDPSKAKLAADPDAKPYFMLRHYVVFNVEQADGIEPLPLDEPLTEHERNDRCEAIIGGYVAPNTRKIRKDHFPVGPQPIREHGDRAYYRPSKDEIVLPPLGQFDDADSYYSTAFHELVHSTGVENRLSRDMGGFFGSDPYSREELVAELGAAMLNATAGIETREDANASYIEHWLSVLKGDRQLIVSAAAAAQKAADLVLGTTFDDDDDTTTRPATGEKPVLAGAVS